MLFAWIGLFDWTVVFDWTAVGGMLAAAIVAVWAARVLGGITAAVGAAEIGLAVAAAGVVAGAAGARAALWADACVDAAAVVPIGSQVVALVLPDAVPGRVCGPPDGSP